MTKDWNTVEYECYQTIDKNNRYRQMKKILTVLFFIGISSTTFAQTEAYKKAVKKCIESNGTISYYEDVVDQMYVMLEKQFESKEVPASVWEEIKKGKAAAMEDLANMIVSAYQGYFTIKDVRKMNALYKTEAGKNMFKKDVLSEEDKIVLNEFYQSETGQKIVSSQDDMNASMSKISETWSSNLYKNVIERLSTKGYNL